MPMEVIDVDSIDTTPDIQLVGACVVGSKIGPAWPTWRRQSEIPHTQSRILVTPASRNRSSKARQVIVLLDDEEENVAGPSKPPLPKKREDSAPSLLPLHNADPGSGPHVVSAMPAPPPGFSNSRKYSVAPNIHQSFQPSRSTTRHTESPSMNERSMKTGPLQRTSPYPSAKPSANEKKGRDRMSRRPPSSSSLRKLEVIDLMDDDTEPSQATTKVNPSQRIPPPTAASAQHVSPDTDSDEDYDRIHAHLDIDQDSNWFVPIPCGKDPPEDPEYDKKYREEMRQLAAEVDRSAALSAREHRRKVTMSRSVKYAPLYQPISAVDDKDEDGNLFVWAKARTALYSAGLNWHFSSFDSKARMYHRHGAVQRFKYLEQVLHKRFSPGPIMSISQFKGMVAVASCVIVDGATIYNQDASLKILYGDRTIPVLKVPPGEEKFETVNDAQFDPQTNHFVSAGNDGKVRVWNYDRILAGGEPTLVKSYGYGEGVTPQGVRFRPDSSNFVTWTSDGCIAVHDTQNLSRIPSKIRLVPASKQQAVQVAAWGKEASSNVIFATSQTSLDWGHESGHHVAYDVTAGRTLFTLEHQGGGECLDVSLRGDKLALVTCNEGQEFELSIYDIRQRNRHALHTTLESVRTWEKETDANRYNSKINTTAFEVNQVLFSTDDHHIACARSDNKTDVYDFRNLSRRLFICRHEEGREGRYADGKYGVTRIQWWDDPNTQRTHLISGGADGCVRMWDIGTEHDYTMHTQGTVIAQSEAYVADFSIGNVWRGEKTLVLGDGSGTIVVKG